MKDIVYVTGNAHKAEYFSKIMGMDIPHQKIDVDELQSLDLKEIVEHKARQAYAAVKKPVIVEDTRLTFNALGKLPGPLIKWFLEELGTDGLCSLLDNYNDRSAVAGAAIAYYDGQKLQVFEESLPGIIAEMPAQTKDGFGWNKVFIPDGSDITLAEMDEETFRGYYVQIKPFSQLSEYINASK